MPQLSHTVAGMITVSGAHEHSRALLRASTEYRVHLLSVRTIFVNSRVREVYSTLQKIHQVSPACGKVFIMSIDSGEGMLRQCTPYSVHWLNEEGFQGNGYRSNRTAGGSSRSIIKVKSN